MRSVFQIPARSVRPQVWFATGLLCASSVLLPGQSTGARTDLKDLTFEELANITVTTVSRHDEKLFTVPAAMTVLTRSEIQDMGALVVPEALREVPGLNVAQITADTWGVGARGFQWQYANKLLVMIDGRSIYSPTSGGVRWEDHPVFLGDLDRVEVVRGPGSSVWGSNAVNGVINIISRSAFETTGTLAFAGTGNELESIVGARQGFRLSDKVAVRVYGQYQSQHDNILPGGASAEDGYRLGFGGARLDWTPTEEDTVTWQAGWHQRRTDYVRPLGSLALPPDYVTVSTVPIRSTGAYASGNWRHAWDEDTSLTLNAYWDRRVRRTPQFDETIDTFDLEAVYQARPSENQQLSAGLSYRLLKSRFDEGFFAFDPNRSRPRLFSGFIHDEISFKAARLKLGLGTKVEHHNTTGWNLQPSLRLCWEPGPNSLVWAAASRAVRTPTLIEQTTALDAVVFPPGVFDPALPASIRIYGNLDLKTEKLTAIEAGWRWKNAAGVSLDVAAFAYDYRDYVIVTADSVSVQAFPPGLILGQTYANGIVGESYGGEVAFTWNPRPSWRLRASADVVSIQLHTRQSDPFGYEQDEDTTPTHSFMLTSDWNLNRRWRIHLAGRHVAAVPYYGISAYAELDARLSCRLNDHLELSLVGRNLLDSSHAEYDSALNRRMTELQRSVALICQWTY